MSAHKLPVLLFDLGGVVIEFLGYDKMNALLGGRLNDDEIRAKWIASPAIQAYERGAMSNADFGTAMVREWHLEMSPDAFLAEYRTWATGLYDGAEDMLRGLKPHHTLACLSNTNPLHWDYIGGDALRGLFDYSFLSFEMGLCKPAPDAFFHVVEKIGERREDIWFFDDTDANVAAARAFGLNTRRVRGLDEVKAALGDIVGSDMR